MTPTDDKSSLLTANIISKSTLDLLLKQDSPLALIALYNFYYYTAKWQKTNRIKASTIFVSNALHIKKDSVIKYKKQLAELGLIEEIRGLCKKTGKVQGWYIQVNNLWKTSTINNINNNSPHSLMGESGQRPICIFTGLSLCNQGYSEGSSRVAKGYPKCISKEYKDYQAQNNIEKMTDVCLECVRQVAKTTNAFGEKCKNVNNDSTKAKSPHSPKTTFPQTQRVDMGDTNALSTIILNALSINNRNALKTNKEDNTFFSPKKKDFFSFSIPTLKEFTAFINEENLQLDPESFYNFYKERKWIANGQPIRDWKELLISIHERGVYNPYGISQVQYNTIKQQGQRELLQWFKDEGYVEGMEINDIVERIGETYYDNQ